MRDSRVSRLLVFAVALLGLAVAAIPRVAASDDHGGHAPPAASPGGRVGLLIADHGEPPEYNEWTYESFREFFQHLIAMGLIPSWLTALETGTILYDANCPACEARSDAPRLIDAWLRPHDGPAAFVPASESLPAHYIMPAGPGFREPDIFEHVGLGAWHEWQRMGGRSPNYDEKLAKKQAVIDDLRAAHGDDVAIRVGYGIDPRIGGGRQGIREALDALVNKDRIESLAVVYHGVGFSDIMQTHHLRHQIAEHLETVGEGDMPIRYAEPIGTTDHYVTAIVDKVNAELSLLPPTAAVAIHLSGHGLSTTTCGDYDCGADAYHRYAANLFARVKPAVEAAIVRSGRTGVFHIYGDSGEGEADPDNKVTSPIEGLDARAAQGWAHVVDVPYEFDSNSRDTLIVLRQGYGREAPDWNHAWESHFTYKNLQVKIANANGGEAHKTEALSAVAGAALDGLVAPAAGLPNAPVVQNTGSHAHSAAASTARAHEHGLSDRPIAAHPHNSELVEFGEMGAEGRMSNHPHEATADAEHQERMGEIAASAHGHASGGAGPITGLLLALAAGGAIGAGAIARGRALPARVVLAAVGVQLAGLAWDVVIHASSGQGVHLLENGGHWLSLTGLVATAAAGLMFIGGQRVGPADAR